MNRLDSEESAFGGRARTSHCTHICLGGDGGAGFIQAGQPISSSETLLNVLAPAVVEQHITFGVSRALVGDREVSAGLMFAPDNRVRGTNLFDSEQTVELEMRQFEFEFGVRL